MAWFRRNAGKVGRLLSSAVILVALFLPFVAIQPVLAVGNTYYVTTAGNDANDGLGTGADHAWLTIQHAADTMVAGDTVYVRTGSYFAWVLATTHSGTAANPITFAAYPGEHPVIDGSLCAIPGSPVGLFTVNQDYIVIDGFEIANSPASAMFYGVLLSSAPDHVTLKNLNIHDIFHDGIVIWEATNTLIDSCIVHDVDDMGGDEGISITADNFEMKNSTIYNVPNGEINIVGSNPIAFGNDNISIHDNEIYGFGTNAAIYIDNQGVPQGNIFIYNNKIHTAGVGIATASEVAPATLSNVNIYNNVFYNNTTAIGVWVYHFDKTINFVNNTLYNNFVGVDFSDDAAHNINCVVRNNIVSANSTGAMISSTGNVTIDHNLFYDTTGTYNTLWGTNNVTGNPLFTSPTSNFSIEYGSPAKDAGSSTGAPSTDYIGTSRPQGAAYDIGAYEYITSPATLVSIAVTPNPPSHLKVSSTQQFTATGTYSDSSNLNITSSVTWVSSNTSIATIAAGGLATGVAAGTTEVSANMSGIFSSNVTLMVKALTSIAVTPNPSTNLAIGSDEQFTATGNYTDNSTEVITSSSSWVSSNTTVATVTVNGGLASGLVAGTTNISASKSGITSANVSLTVLTPTATLVSIAVTPSSPPILTTGETQQFVATGTYNDNSTAIITSSVSWISSDTTRAYVDGAGLATGIATGSTTITASFAGITSPGITLEVLAYGSGGLTSGSKFAQDMFPMVVILAPVLLAFKLVDTGEGGPLTGLFVFGVMVTIAVAFLTVIVPILNGL